MSDIYIAPGALYDLGPFFGGDQGLLGYQVGSEQIQIVQATEDDGIGRFLMRKNHFAEQLAIGKGWICRGDDMSPDMATYYQTHTRTSSGDLLTGHVWFPRYASMGSWFISRALVQFFSKGSWKSQTHGTVVNSASPAGTPQGLPFESTWKIQFVNYFSVIQPVIDGHDYPSRMDVVSLDGSVWNGQTWALQETWYFQKGYGLIGWTRYDAAGKRAAFNWFEADLSEPPTMDIYVPPTGWRKIAVKSLEAEMDAHLSTTPEQLPDGENLDDANLDESGLPEGFQSYLMQLQTDDGAALRIRAEANTVSKTLGYIPYSDAWRAISLKPDELITANGYVWMQVIFEGLKGWAAYRWLNSARADNRLFVTNPALDVDETDIDESDPVVPDGSPEEDDPEEAPVDDSQPPAGQGEIWVRLDDYDYNQLETSIHINLALVLAMMGVRYEEFNATQAYDVLRAAADAAQAEADAEVTALAQN
ncbi:hypothetical protein G4Y79_05280 [Phototrophicus methaneseepsis]|uniref:Uncharacterized protein n=1 Tax=Phototrophicus methaneseepsis TaxID=2710758 RepID=A0A7S8EB91_9CHLR|nr:hypothetical protein [Phototrophicus methaneseepsis]QPC83793.1 hypothetical protein G4Y79_05280 [Phototrophicus methaneseepsis]